MDNSPVEEDVLDEDNHDLFINFPPEVQKAIEEVNCLLVFSFFF